MKFYFWILIIVIVLNLMVVYTSVGEYIRSIEVEKADITFLIFAFLSFLILLTAFGFLFAKIGKY